MTWNQSESMKKTELIPETSTEGQLMMKALEGVAGQTGVSHSRHRKMAPFLDCVVRERRWFAEPCKSRNPAGSSLPGMGAPEVILQIKGERERKSGFYTLLHPPGFWLVEIWHRGNIQGPTL